MTTSTSTKIPPKPSSSILLTANVAERFVALVLGVSSLVTAHLSPVLDLGWGKGTLSRIVISLYGVGAMAVVLTPRRIVHAYLLPLALMAATLRASQFINLALITSVDPFWGEVSDKLRDVVLIGAFHVWGIMAHDR